MRSDRFPPRNARNLRILSAQALDWATAGLKFDYLHSDSPAGMTAMKIGAVATNVRNYEGGCVAKIGRPSDKASD